MEFESKAAAKAFLKKYAVRVGSPAKIELAASGETGSTAAREYLKDIATVIYSSKAINKLAEADAAAGATGATGSGDDDDADPELQVIEDEQAPELSNDPEEELL